MGSQTDEAERRVREQRTLIERHIEDLEHRVGDDLSSAGERLTHHLSHLPDLVPGGSRLMSQAEEHPYAAVASSLGLGVALGFMSGGSDSGRSSGHQNGHSNSRGGGNSMMGAASGLMSMLSTTVMSPLRPYMEDAARQVVAGFAERQRASSGARQESGQEHERTSRDGSGPA